VLIELETYLQLFDACVVLSSNALRDLALVFSRFRRLRLLCGTIIPFQSQAFSVSSGQVRGIYSIVVSSCKTCAGGPSRACELESFAFGNQNCELTVCFPLTLKSFAHLVQLFRKTFNDGALTVSLSLRIDESERICQRGRAARSCRTIDTCRIVKW